MIARARAMAARKPGLVFAMALAALFVPAPALAETGDLTYLGCIANLGANGCEQPAHDSLRQPFAVAISGDGKSVYVGSHGAVTWFKRKSSGALANRAASPTTPSMGARRPATGRSTR
jgi:hypothetical protein